MEAWRWRSGDSDEHLERTVLTAERGMNWMGVSQGGHGNTSWEAAAAVQARDDQNLD